MNTNEESKGNVTTTILPSSAAKYTTCKIFRKEPNVSIYLAKDKHNVLSIIKSIDITELSEYEKKLSKQEIKIIDRLNYPYIIQNKEHFFTIKGTTTTLNIVMEYVSGGDLSQKIKGQTTKYIGESQILDWFTQLCLAVKHLHDRKILHRDIKPSNIFLQGNGVIKLGDFGIAKCLNSSKERAITKIGSPDYISPEIMLNRPYSFKSDIWAMGVTLFELCSLKLPFNLNDQNTINTTRKIPNVIAKIPKHYSKDLKNIIGLMLKGNPIDRPQVIQLLSMEIIHKRISKFLTNEQYKEEFNHTVLKDFYIDKEGRKECDKCIKAKLGNNNNNNNNKQAFNCNNEIIMPSNGSGYVDNLNDVLVSNNTIYVNNNNCNVNGIGNDVIPNNNYTNRNSYFNENEVIQGIHFNINNLLNSNLTCNNGNNNNNTLMKSPINKKIMLIKKQFAENKISLEMNLESKRKEIEESIGVNLLKDIYLFLNNSPFQLLNIPSIKALEENQYNYALINYLAEKQYSFDDRFKGISKLDEIRKLILTERKLYSSN